MNEENDKRNLATRWTVARSGSRAFTIIELMVALTGALFFTIFVFMLTRDVSRFFQGQARLSESTLATVTGFERLRADIARAGYQASPNLARDRRRCPRSTPGTVVAPQQMGGDFGAFPGLQEMGLLRIVPSDASTYAPNAVLDNNAGGILPDRLVLYGNYTTAEQFPVARINWGTAQPQIILQHESLVMRRLGIVAGTTPNAQVLAILNGVFRAGQILRLVDTSGREQYAVVAGVVINNSVPIINLGAGISLIRKDAGGLCGIRSVCTGCLVNPVDIIRYELVEQAVGQANHPGLAYSYEGIAPPYENTRLDLYRYQLTPDLNNDANVLGTPNITNSAEIVAEYAVDLRLGLTVLDNPATGALSYIPETALDATRLRYAGVPYLNPADQPVTATTTAGPHFIRGVSVRLNVRNREAEFEAPIVLNATGADQLYRVQVDPGNPGADQPPQYARMRSLRTHVATRNTQNLMWN